MVSVNVEDQICSLPALLVHVGFGVLIVGTRIVNVGRLKFADKAFQFVEVGGASVANHNAIFE